MDQSQRHWQQKLLTSLLLNREGLEKEKESDGEPGPLQEDW